MLGYTKEATHCKTENPATLAFWYSKRKSFIRDTPAHLIYNMNECGFTPGQDKHKKIISQAEIVKIGHIKQDKLTTVIEYITAIGIFLNLIFIFEDQNLMKM
jgi:hypothetical protein